MTSLPVNSSAGERPVHRQHRQHRQQRQHMQHRHRRTEGAISPLTKNCRDEHLALGYLLMALRSPQASQLRIETAHAVRLYIRAHPPPTTWHLYTIYKAVPAPILHDLHARDSRTHTRISRARNGARAYLHTACHVEAVMYRQLMPCKYHKHSQANARSCWDGSQCERRFGAGCWVGVYRDAHGTPPSHPQHGGAPIYF
jgi:hypothetical protein